MKIRWDPSNTRLLITSVEVRPALWGTTLDDYSKKNITLTKWEEVAEELGCSAKEVKDKWRSMRVYFNTLRRQILAKKSGQGLDELFVPNWDYYKDMSFLIPTVTAKPSVSNLSPIQSTSLGRDDQINSDGHLDEPVEHAIVFSTNELHTVLQEKEVQREDGNFVPKADVLTPSNQKPIQTPIRNRMTLAMSTKKKQECDESSQMIELMGTVKNALENKTPPTLDDHFTAQLGLLLKEIPNSAEKEKFKMKLMEMMIDFKYNSSL